MSISLILLILLILLLVGALPTWGHSRNWGYGPSGGLGLLVLSLLARRAAVLPSRLATLGAVVGVLLLIVYLGRLIILTPTNPVVAAAAGVTGLILSPAFYLWLGRELRRR